MQHQIMLRVRTTMSRESLVKVFPKTILVPNPEAEKFAAGHLPLEVVYVDEVESGEDFLKFEDVGR